MWGFLSLRGRRYNHGDGGGDDGGGDYDGDDEEEE